jgi:hypothetical protein
MPVEDEHGAHEVGVERSQVVEDGRTLVRQRRQWHGGWLGERVGWREGWEVREGLADLRGRKQGAGSVTATERSEMSSARGRADFRGELGEQVAQGRIVAGGARG